MGIRSPLRWFLNGDKIEPVKIILSPCFVNISDGDKWFEAFLEWQKDFDKVINSNASNEEKDEYLA